MPQRMAVEHVLQMLAAGDSADDLRALLGERYAVVGVVTQPDRPQGRSRSTLVPPPVKVEAERACIVT